MGLAARQPERLFSGRILFVHFPGVFLDFSALRRGTVFAPGGLAGKKSKSTDRSGRQDTGGRPRFARLEYSSRESGDALCLGLLSEPFAAALRLCKHVTWSF